MTADDKIKFSDHTKRLWSEQREKMMEASKRAGRTFSARVASGQIVVNRDKISESVTRRYLEGGFQWARGRYEESPSKSTKPSSYYRSSWELDFMRRLDADPTVLEWTHEPLWIRYEWEGRRRYIPDFRVRYSDGRTELVELGVKAVKDLPRNAAKHAAARDLCEKNGWLFMVLSESDLLSP